MYRTLIIDDEGHMCDTLAKLLARHFPQAEITGCADGVSTGIQAIRDHQPDIVLLDIQLADGTAFDLLEQFPGKNFKVIFITAYDHYAVQAFRFSAVDYLLKPVNPGFLVEAMNRAGTSLQEHFNLQVKALEENLQHIPKQQKKVILRTTESIHLVEIKDIVTCESDDCYTKLNFADGSHILVSKTLKEFDEMFSDCGFFRVHKSYLINLLHIKRFERQDGGILVLTNHIRIPVASRKRDELLEIMEKLV